MSSRTRTPLLLVCLLLVAAEPPTDTLVENPLVAGANKQLPARPFVRLGVPRLQQQHGIVVVISPDGKTMAIDDTLWDVDTGKKLRDLQMSSPFRNIWDLAFAPNGKILAGQCGFSVRLWETATGKELRVLSIPEGAEFLGLAFSPDGKQLAASLWGEEHKPSSILLWETASGREIRRFAGQQNAANQLAFSADGKRLLALVSPHPLPNVVRRSPDLGSLVAWDLANGKQLFSRNKAPLVRLSPDGRFYTLQGEDGRIQIHDLEKRRLVRTLDSRDLLHVFRADGKVLAATDEQNVTQLWDVASGGRLQCLVGDRIEERKDYRTWYFPFGFSPDGRFLATGSHHDGNHSGRTCLWDTTRSEELLPAADHFLAVTCQAFSADGKTLVSGSIDRTLHLWDTTARQHLRRFKGHKERIEAVALSPSGRFVASSSRDKTLRLWDARTGRELHCLDVPANAALSLTFLEDDKTLQWWDLHGNIHRYDVPSGKRLRRFRSRRGVFHAAPLGADGLSAPAKFTTNDPLPWPEDVLPSVLWKKQESDKTPVAERFHGLQRVCVSSDGRMAATVELTSLGGLAGPQCRVRVWEIGTGGLIADLGQLSGLSFFPIFSRNGWGLFTGCDGWGSISPCPCLGWDLLSCQLVVSLRSPTRILRCLTVSPDGRTLTAGGEDASVLVWDIAGVFQPPSAPPLSDAELRRQAECLSAPDAAAAYRAMYRLAQSPEQTAPFLHERLRKLAPPMARLLRLIADLDDDAFAVREKATEQLQHMGPCIEGALRSARDNTSSPEARRRLDLLLEKVPASSRQRIVLEVLRGISVLERIGTRKARLALRDLAKTASDSDVGMEAKAALQRLTTRSPVKP